MTKSHKKKNGVDGELTPGSHKQSKGDPPKDDPPRSENHPEGRSEKEETPIVKQLIISEEVLDFLKKVRGEVEAMNERINKVEKQSQSPRYRSKGSKRDDRKEPHVHRKEDSKGLAKKLIGEFDDVETDKTNPDFYEGLESEVEEKNPRRKEDSEKKEGSYHKAASSEGRTVSIFDRIGKKLTEHDLRLKLEKISAGKKERQDREKGERSHRRDQERSHRREERRPSPRRDQERSHRREERRTPPRRRQDCKDDQEASSVPKKTQSHHGSTGEGHHKGDDKGAKVGDYKLEDLKKALDEMNTEKWIFANMGSSSPFTHEIRTAPLPTVFRSSNPDMTYNGETGPAEFVIRFNNEMDVYQVSLMARCRLFAASLRGSAQQWFAKLGALVTIDSWAQFVDIFIKQFQSSMLYAPPVSTLENINKGSGSIYCIGEHKETRVLESE